LTNQGYSLCLYFRPVKKKLNKRHVRKDFDEKQNCSLLRNLAEYGGIEATYLPELLLHSQEGRTPPRTKLSRRKGNTSYYLKNKEKNRKVT